MPQLKIALLGNRAAVTFDLTYRFRLRQERVERQMRVTLFVERRPEGWRILRDNVVFPSEPQPDAGG
jgi:ketosteroid isomerase-like protein